MAYPQILSAGAEVTSSATTLALSYPATVQAGKLIFALIECYGSSTFTPLAGWTQDKRYVGNASTNGNVCFLFHKTATGSETGTETFTFSVSNRKAGFMFATDADVLDSVSVGGNAPSATSIDQDTITPSGTDRLVCYVFFAAHAAAAIVKTDMTPHGTIIQEAARNQTNSVYVGVGYEQHATATETPVRTSTSVNALDRLGQFTFAIALSATDPAITSINNGSDIEDGQQDVEIEHEGFSTITGVTLNATDGASFNFSKSLVFSSGGAGITLFDMPDIAALVEDAAGVPLTSSGYACSIEITDGTDTLSYDVVVEPKSGYSKSDAVSAVTTVGSVYNGFAGSILDGTQVIAPPNVNVSASGILEFTDPDVDFGDIYTFQIFDQEDGTWKVHQIVITEEEDAGNPGGGSSQGLYRTVYRSIYRGLA